MHLNIGIPPFPIKIHPSVVVVTRPPIPSKARSFLVGPVASIPHADARDASYVLKRMAARGHRPDPETHTASIVAGKLVVGWLVSNPLFWGCFVLGDCVIIEVQYYPGLFFGFR